MSLKPGRNSYIESEPGTDLLSIDNIIYDFYLSVTIITMVLPLRLHIALQLHDIT